MRKRLPLTRDERRKRIKYRYELSILIQLWMDYRPEQLIDCLVILGEQSTQND